MVLDLKVYGSDGKVAGEVTLPSVFHGRFRKDIVERALLSEMSRKYQPQGHSLLAGLQTTAVYVGRYDAGYRVGRHMGIAIRPRQKLGGGAQGDVRRIPSSVKGRRAHPHKIEKTLREHINVKEYVAALRSAVAASADAELVRTRHSVKVNELPLIIDEKAEALQKTKDVSKMLVSLGIADDLERSKKPELRKGLRRLSNRRKFRKSVLIVASKGSSIIASAANIAGVDSCSVDDISIERLAPGAEPRLVIWSSKAVEGLESAIEAKGEKKVL